MRLPRLTTRRLMVVVAVVALGLTAWILGSRAIHYHYLAQGYADQEKSYKESANYSLERLEVHEASKPFMLELVRDKIGFPREWRLGAKPSSEAGQPIIEAYKFEDIQTVDLKESLRRAKAQASYYSRLRQQYERAARHPWLPVPPDPPPPK